MEQIQQTETRHISLTDTAKLIRNALKNAFPLTKFSVRSKSYSGGSSIDVDYTNGEPINEVENIAKQFAGATFDGMTDCKDYIKSEFNGERVHFGCDFVFVERQISDEDKLKVAHLLANYYNIEFKTIDSYPFNNGNNWHYLVWQYIRDKHYKDLFKDVQGDL